MSSPLSLRWAEFREGSCPGPVPGTVHLLACRLTFDVGWSHQQPAPGLCLSPALRRARGCPPSPGRGERGPAGWWWTTKPHHRLPGYDLGPARDQVGSCVQVQAAGLMQCACSCLAGECCLPAWGGTRARVAWHRRPSLNLHCLTAGALLTSMPWLRGLFREEWASPHTRVLARLSRKTSR